MELSALVPPQGVERVGGAYKGRIDLFVCFSGHPNGYSRVTGYLDFIGEITGMTFK
jgi:hypothetical protein